MHRLLGFIFGIRADERSIALLMALYHYLLLVTFYLLKPVRDSLFLAERGAMELPFVFILTTVLIIPVAGLHTRAGRSVNLWRLIHGVSLFLVAGIVGLRVFITFDAAWVVYALYAWVSIYGVLVTSQFWLLANAVFTAAQAKRVFALLSLGAVLGALTGGEVTGLLVDELDVDSHNLLWLAAGFLVGTTGLVEVIRQRQPAWMVDATAPGEAPDELGLQTALNALRGSHHLWIIMGIIALTVITTTVVDYQFKTLAHRAYENEEALTSFMGRFYGRVSLAALIVQFVLAPYLIRWFGIGGALSFLPAALAFGAIGMLIAPGLVAAALMRGSEQSLKHSIDKTGRELLFVPITLERKKRVKVFIDLFVDQGMQGIGGVLLLALTLGMGVGVYELSAIVLVLIGMWGWLTIRARHSYTDQFRRKLREQDGLTPPKDDDVDDEPLPDELSALIDELCGQGEWQTRAALDRLEEGETTVPVHALRSLLDHQSSSVRAQAIRVLRKRGVLGFGEAVATYMTDPDPDVQLEAARYMYCDVKENRVRRLQRGLAHNDPRIRAVTVALIAEEGGPAERDLVSEELLRELVETQGTSVPEQRVQVARLLGVIDTPYRNDFLHRLLHDTHPDVVRQAIESAGQTQDRSFVPSLLQRLSDPAFEETARAALASYGTRILGTLYDHYTDPAVDLAIRRRIPFILALQPASEVVQVLQFSLDNLSIPVRHSVVRALSKLHARSLSLQFDERIIDRALRADLRHFAALGQIVHVHHRSSHATTRGISRRQLLMLRTESLERVFRLLGLRFDQRDIYTAYRGITSQDPVLRSNAVEFVDNLLDWKTSRLLLPLLDDPGGRQAAEHAPVQFGLRLNTWPRALEYMLKADDPRLHAIALHGKGYPLTDDQQTALQALDDASAEPAEEEVAAAAAQSTPS
jgi:ATP/ADP translocase